MVDKKQSYEEWLAEERARLDKGFSFEPQPSSEASAPGTADQIAVGLGLGAGVLGGAVAPHPNPVTFEGCKADVIATALRKEIADDDTRVQVDKTSGSVVVTILQSQENRPHDFSPALTATLVETADALTVTVSDLNQGAVRGALSSVGSTVLNQAKELLTGRGRSGVGGLLDAAGQVMEGVDDLVEDIQDLGLPKRVWGVIDRVGGAAEEAYLDQQRKEREQQQKREAAERAWTHCEWCGQVYGSGEDSVTECPSCGAPRGAKPNWLK